MHMSLFFVPFVSLQALLAAAAAPAASSVITPDTQATLAVAAPAPVVTAAASSVGAPTRAEQTSKQAQQGTAAPAANVGERVVAVAVLPSGAATQDKRTAAAASAAAQSAANLAASAAQEAVEAAQASIAASSANQPGGVTSASAAKATAAAEEAVNAANLASDASALATAQAARASEAAAATRTSSGVSPPPRGATSVTASTIAVTPVAEQDQTHVWWLHTTSPTVQKIWTILAAVSFTAAIKTMCMAGNVMVQISPFPQVRRWELRSCTGEADPAPYVSIAFGGWQWCYYGLFAFLLTGRSGFLILVHSNCLGAVLGTYYVFAFYMHCKHQASRDNLNRYLSSVFALAMFQACAVLALPLERALFLTGLVSSFCSFLGAVSMLVTVPQVLSTKNAKSIPGPLVLANLLSSVVWVLCGMMLNDPLVTGPNVASAMASSLCLYLKQKYPSDEEPAGDVDMEKAPPGKAGLLKASEDTPFVKARSMDTYGAQDVAARVKVGPASPKSPKPARSTAGDAGSACDMGGTGETC